MSERPLLMIPGPIEVSPGVLEAFSAPPPSHLAPALIEAHGAAIERLRAIWLAPADSQPFIVAGGGTLAMEMAAANVVEPGERAVVVNTGYFSDRMAEMLRRQGAEVVEVGAPVGEVPPLEEVERALSSAAVKALFVTHVDTSTGVLAPAEALARLASEHGALSVFDGVCATAGEELRKAEWGVDVYLTASQKAIGLPAGLALMVVSERALGKRRRRSATAPPMVLDWLEWLPIQQAYEERRPSYFSTPATNLVAALAVGLEEILDPGIEERFELHRRAAKTLRGIWSRLGLETVPTRGDWTAHTLSALYFPEGVDASLLAGIAKRGVVMAGGLHPEIRARYFRVGHMGYSLTRPDHLRRAARAIHDALREAGHPVPAGLGEEIDQAFAGPS